MTASSRWTSRLLCSLGCLLLVSACALLELPLQSSTVAAEAPSDLNIIPGDTAALMTFQFDELWKSGALKPTRDLLTKEGSQFFKEIEQMTGLTPEVVERVTLVISTLTGLESRGPGFGILVTTTKPYDAEKLLKGMNAFSGPELQRMRFEKRQFAPLPLPKGDFKKLPELPKGGVKEPARKPFKRDLDAPFYFIENERGIIFLVDERTFLIFPRLRDDDVMGILSWFGKLLKGKQKGNLSSEFVAAANKHHIVARLDVQALAKAIENDLPEIFPAKSLLAANSAIITVDIAADSTLAITLQCADAATAKKVEESLKALLVLSKDVFPGLKREMARDSELKPFLPLAESLEEGLKDAAVEAKANGVTLVIKAKKTEAIIGTMLATTLLDIQQAAERKPLINNYKEIALAVFNFESTFNEFPFPGIGKNVRLKKNEKPLLSWRVAILPFIEEEKLYRQFKIDEPWDSDNNKKLIVQMPKMFAPRKGVVLKEGHTLVQIFTGKDALGPGMTPLKFGDGTSNTIMFAEAAEGVPWTKPEDMPFDLDKELPKLGGNYNGNLFVAMADGSVRYIDRKRISDKTLKAMITPNGGEVVDFNDR